MACQTYPPSSSSLKSSSLILERYFPKLAVHNGRGFSIQQTECARPCCVLCTHSRAAERPLAASLPATPALGHRRCLIVFTVFRGAANDPEIHVRQILGTPLRRYTYPSQFIRQPPARWFTPNVMDHRVWPSTQASQILKLLRIGGVQDHSGHPGTSQPLTPQPPFWKATSQNPLSVP